MAVDTRVPSDWYRSSISPGVDALFFDEEGVDTARLALEILRPDGFERILDLACAAGGRVLELCRHGYDVIGVDSRQPLLEFAGYNAERKDLLPWFYELDPREIEFEREFDIVLSVGGGAIEHFDRDEENRRAFAAAARALRPGGRLLMQTPNVLHVEAHLPERTWIEGNESIEVIEQHWNAPTRRLDGTRRSLMAWENLVDCEPMPFHRRLYTIEELAEIFEAIGLRLVDVFDERGRPCAPSEEQQQLFVEARVDGRP